MPQEFSTRVVGIKWITTLTVGMGEQNPTDDELIEQLTAYGGLSARQAEVLTLMANEIEKHDTAEEARKTVAKGLGIQPSTVDTYYRRALENISQASHLLEITDNNFTPEQLDELNLEQNQGPVIECSCGSTNVRTEDMGDHGFALICEECDATLQAG